MIEQKDLPLVSVVIATYRREKDLENALNSLLLQSYRKIEIIVADDNADIVWNSKVEKIISETQLKLNDLTLIYKQNKTNLGSAKTRNVAIGCASGEYVTFLDDDDVYLPQKIEHQLAQMLEENSDYSITDLKLYVSDDRIVETRKRSYIKNTDQISLLKYHFMYHMSGTDSLMFKKDYLIKIGCFPLIDIGDEFYLMKEAICGNGKISYLPRCDVKAYVHYDNKGLSSSDKKIDGENVLFNYKKTFFHLFDGRTKRYIKMRHYAVLAFSEFGRKNYLNFIGFSIKSFFCSPINSIILFSKCFASILFKK